MQHTKPNKVNPAEAKFICCRPYSLDYRLFPCQMFVSFHHFFVVQTRGQSILCYFDNALSWIQLAYDIPTRYANAFSSTHFLSDVYPILFDDMFEFFSLILDNNKIVRHEISFCHCCPIIFCIWKTINYPVTNWY